MSSFLAYRSSQFPIFNYSAVKYIDIPVSPGTFINVTVLLIPETQWVIKPIQFLVIFHSVLEHFILFRLPPHHLFSILQPPYPLYATVQMVISTHFKHLILTFHKQGFVHLSRTVQ